MLYNAYYVYLLHLTAEVNMLLLSDHLIHGEDLQVFDNNIVIQEHDSFQENLTKHFEGKYQNWCLELQEHLKQSIVKFQGEDDKSCLVRYLKIRLLDGKGNMIKIPSTINLEGETINRFPSEPVSLDVENATATVDFGKPVRIIGINSSDTLTIDAKFPNYRKILRDFRNLYKLSTLIERCYEYVSNSLITVGPKFDPVRAHFTDYLNNVVKGTRFETSAESIIDNMLRVSAEDSSNLISPRNIAVYILAEEIIETDYGIDFFDMYRSTKEFINVIERQFDEIGNSGNSGNLVKFVEELIKDKNFDMDNEETYKYVL
jgi:hypothetical protein